MSLRISSFLHADQFRGSTRFLAFSSGFKKAEENGLRRNEAITAKEILFIDKDDQKHVMAPKALLNSIDRKIYDLVEVNANHSPPICRLASKSQAFKRLQTVEEAAARERLKCREKEIRFGTSMAPHDYGIRMGRVEEILEKAFRVKIVIEPKGVAGRDALAKERLWKQISSDLAEKYAKNLAIISSPQVEFRNLTATIALASAKPSLNKKEE